MIFAKYYLMVTCVFAVFWWIRLSWGKFTNRIPAIAKDIPLLYMALVPILIWPVLMFIHIGSAIKGRFLLQDKLEEIERDLRR